MARGLNGTSQYLSAADNAVLQVPFPIAVGMWFKGGAQGNFKYLLSKLCVAGQFASYGLSTQGTGDLRFAVAYATGAGTFTNSPTAAAATVFDSNWHHFLGTYDGANVRLYVDGVEVGTGTAETRAIVYTNQSLFVGSFDGTQLYATGSMAEVAIWGSIPDASERAALAKGYSPLLIRPTDLATHWPLMGRYSPEIDVINAQGLTVTSATTDPHPRTIQRSRPLWIPPGTGGGPTVVSGTASLTGAGSLTAGSTLIVPATASLAAAGTVTATATLIQLATATLTGVGTLAATSGSATNGSATLTGAGTLTASGVTGRSGAAALAGSGSLAATGAVLISGAASLAGAGTLTSAVTVAFSGAANLLGASSLTAGQASGTGPRILSRTTSDRITSRTTGGHL